MVSCCVKASAANYLHKEEWVVATRYLFCTWQRGLRQQLLRMLEFACQEELLDAPMCEAAVSGVLLLCTRQGQVTAAVSSSTTPALEALAALATHCCSDDTVLHADGELVGVP